MGSSGCPTPAPPAPPCASRASPGRSSRLPRGSPTTSPSCATAACTAGASTPTDSSGRAPWTTSTSPARSLGRTGRSSRSAVGTGTLW
uniref:Uncharacterized protein n=1 Tax=Arcella intermedia TaxID=1963864 RepID=A0A6B2LUQ4_9EUKA